MHIDFFFKLTVLLHLFVIRCGRLTRHISLPYSIVGTGHMETAIKDTYCKRICGECTHEVQMSRNCKNETFTHFCPDVTNTDQLMHLHLNVIHRMLRPQRSAKQ